MAEKDSKQIKIDATTKLRIDLLKGNDTYNNFLCKMLAYFENTGIKPESRVISPVVAVKDQASRIIEVVRGVEKSQKVYFEYIKKLLDKIYPSSLAASQVSPNFNLDDYIPVSEVQELLNRAEEVEKEKIQLANELKQTREKLELSAQKQSVTSGLNVNKALEILAVFDQKKKKSANPEIYEINRSDFDAWINRLKEELKK